MTTTQYEYTTEAFTAGGLRWSGATDEQMNFMRRVYEARVARSQRRGRFVNDVPNADLDRIERNRKMRKEAAPFARQLLAEARQAIAASGMNVEIGIASAYRSASKQFQLWQRYFPNYYRRTQAQRQSLPGGEHGAEALRIMSRFVGARIATPGYSNHNKGLAIDIKNVENGRLARNSTRRQHTSRWRNTWLWNWLTNNAQRFHFYQNTNIDEPWHWEFRHQPNQVLPSQPQSTPPDFTALLTGLRNIIPGLLSHQDMATTAENLSGMNLRWSGASSAALQFMRAVYAMRVRRSSSRGTFVADVPNSQLSVVEGSYKLRSEAALSARRLLAAARAAIALTNLPVQLGLTSAYRPASRQFQLWQRYFPDYYRRTQTHRQSLSGGEHGAEAQRYMSRFVGVRIGTPGYSNHNNGMAMDLRNEEHNRLLRNKTNRTATAAWRGSWLWRWLTDHAHEYMFYQNNRIDEPWHWEYRLNTTQNSEWTENLLEMDSAFKHEDGAETYTSFSDEFEGEISLTPYMADAVSNLTQAISANRRYGISLGWNVHHNRINDLLLPFSGLQNVSLGEDAFAHALSKWQQRQGLSSTDSDGILGPNTWRLMQRALGISSTPVNQNTSSPVAISQVLPATGNALMAWSNSTVLSRKYPDIQRFTAVFNSVVNWGVPNPSQYIEAAINEWNSSPTIHRHFGSFDGTPNRSYLNLRRLYASKGIQNPAQYFSTNIQRYTFFNRSSPGHIVLKQKLERAEQRLRAAGKNFVLQSAYSFVPRTFNRNINKLSNHALGKAVDIDPRSNPHITNGHEIRIIEAVCNTILVNGFLRERNPDVFLRASNHFKAIFNSQWISQQTDPNILTILRSRSRMRKLEKYARLGFCTLPAELVRALQNAGLTWGGTWSSAKDFMHFEIS